MEPLITRRLATAGVLVAVFTLIVLGSADAQAVTCDTAIVNQRYGVQGYQSYGDRCEGVYTMKRSAGMTLELASFTATDDSTAPVEAKANGEVVLDWIPYVGNAADSSVLADSGIRIHAQNFPRERIAYAMDTRQTAGAGQWRWPTSVLAAQDIKKIAVRDGEPDVGLVGRTHVKVAGVDTVVYVPLRVRKRPGPEHSSLVEYRVVLYPGTKIELLSYKVARRGSEGKVIQLHRSFTGEQPFTIAIADPGPQGLYSLEISARTGAGDVTMTPILFYHAGSAGTPRSDTPH